MATVEKFDEAAAATQRAVQSTGVFERPGRHLYGLGAQATSSSACIGMGCVKTTRPGNYVHNRSCLHRYCLHRHCRPSCRPMYLFREQSFPLACEVVPVRTTCAGTCTHTCIRLAAHLNVRHPSRSIVTRTVNTALLSPSPGYGAHACPFLSYDTTTSFVPGRFTKPVYAVVPLPASFQVWGQAPRLRETFTPSLPVKIGEILVKLFASFWRTYLLRSFGCGAQQRSCAPRRASTMWIVDRQLPTSIGPVFRCLSQGVRSVEDSGGHVLRYTKHLCMVWRGIQRCFGGHVLKQLQRRYQNPANKIKSLASLLYDEWRGS